MAGVRLDSVTLGATKPAAKAAWQGTAAKAATASPNQSHSSQHSHLLSSVPRHSVSIIHEPLSSVCSSLEAGQGDALNKGTLGEEEEHDDGQGDHRRGGHQHAPLRAEAADEG